MAQNLEVVLKLTSEGASKVAGDMKGVAKEAQAAAKATKSLADADKELAQSRERMRTAMQDANNSRSAVDRSRPAFDARDEAMRRINRQERERAVNREMRQLGHGPNQPGMLGGAMRALGPLIGAAALVRGMSGAADHMENVAQRPGGESGMAGVLGGMGKSALHAIPIVGDLSKAIEKFADAAGGSTSKIAAAQRHFETSQRMIAGQGAVNAAERSARSEMFGHARTAATSQIMADSQSAFAAAVSSDPTKRAIDREVDRARFGVSGAQAIADQRRREASGARPSGMTEAEQDAIIKERQERAQDAARNVRDKERALKTAEGEMFTREKPKRAELAEAQADLAAKQAQLAEAIRAKEEDTAAIKERQKAANDANLAVAQKQFELAKAQVAVDQERLDKMKSLAQTIGSAQQGDPEEALRILKAIKEGGIDSVSREEAAFASPFAPGFVEQAQQQGGQNNPLFNQLSQFQPVGNIGGQIGELEAKIVADNEVILAQFAQAQADANKEFMSEIAQTITDAFKLARQQIRLGVEKEINQGNLQRTVSGG